MKSSLKLAAKEMRERRETILPLLVAAVSLLAYSQFFGLRLAEFDAVAKIVSHSSVDAAGILGIFTQPEQHYLLHSENYRPLTSLFLWVVFLLAGMNFAVFHMAGFFLHAINSALVFFLARKLVKDKSGVFSFIAAIAFALHPINLNSVLFASRVHELLLAFSLIASLLTLMKYTETKKCRFYLFSVLFCAIGIFSKEAGSLIPFILFLYLCVFSRERRFKGVLLRSFRLSLPYFSLILLYFGLMVLALGKVGGYLATPKQDLSFIMLSFFGLLVYPIDFLGIDFPVNIIAFFNGTAFNHLSVIVIFGSGALALKYLSKAKGNMAAVFLIWCMLVYLAAYSVYGFIAPWYAYTAVMPFSLLLAILLKRGVETSDRPYSRIAIPAVSILLISIVACSPLLTAYRQPGMAGSIMEDIYNQTVVLAGQLPEGSSILLVNYPEYMIFPDGGFRYSINMVNEGSVQAIIDYYVPGRHLEALSLTGSLIFSKKEDMDISTYWKRNCVFVVKNDNVSSFKIYFPSKWKESGNQTEGIIIEPLKSGNTETIEMWLPNRGWENESLFVYDGKGVQAIRIADFCK